MFSYNPPAARLEPISPLNTNYDPPRPWTCMTHAAHECTGTIVGKVGAYPVCQAGAAAELAARAADTERIQALLADPEMQARLAEEARIERMIESR
jgi:hypothetical protein